MLEATVLGCGTAGGVPRLGSGWGACDPDNPRNRRSRASLLITRRCGKDETRVLVDMSPDLRQQLLDADVRDLDAVFLTHEHADQTHGIDDLRPLAIERQRPILAYASAQTDIVLRQRFPYCFNAVPRDPYSPFIDLSVLDTGTTKTIEGSGGNIDVTPFRVIHGDIDAWGFRVGGIAYASDVSVMPAESYPALCGLDLLIVDAMRYEPYHTHFCVADALALVDEVRPRRTVLTNLHADLDYKELQRQLPRGVEPAFDGMMLLSPDAAPVQST